MRQKRKLPSLAWHFFAFKEKMSGKRQFSQVQWIGSMGHLGKLDKYN